MVVAEGGGDVIDTVGVWGSGRGEDGGQTMEYSSGGSGTRGKGRTRRESQSSLAAVNGVDGSEACEARLFF
jgi:hypothetical protein